MGIIASEIDKYIVSFFFYDKGLVYIYIFF